MAPGAEQQFAQTVRVIYNTSVTWDDSLSIKPSVLNIPVIYIHHYV